MTDRRYRVIDETQFNILGTFESREVAVDYVAALLAINDEDYLDMLTVAHDEEPPLAGDALREALRNQPTLRQ